MTKRTPIVPGAIFGALKVIQRWAPQSGNVAWVYWCRNCGHHGKRLGATLLRSSYTCPNCKAKKNVKPAAYPEHDPVRVAEVMLGAPDPPQWGRRAALTISRKLGDCTNKELVDMAARIHVEIRKRRKLREEA